MSFFQRINHHFTSKQTLWRNEAMCAGVVSALAFLVASLMNFVSKENLSLLINICYLIGAVAAVYLVYALGRVKWHFKR